VLAVDHANLSLRIGMVAAFSIYSTIILLLLWIVTLRFIRQSKEQRRKKVSEIWRPVFSECLLGVPDTLPQLETQDHIVFLYLWNHYYESIRGEATASLVELARRLGTDRFAKQLLHARLLRRRLLAIVTLGHLGERSVWNDLAALLNEDNAFLSFVAAKALTQIDAEAAIPLLIPVISRRSDWSPLKVVAMFGNAKADLAADTIARAACQAEADIAARLIRHLAVTRSSRALPPLRTLLAKKAVPDDVTAACLFLFGQCSDPRDLDTVRAYLAHPTWYVRLQAASALGKMGVEEDEARLVGLLSDDVWWVRYRVAEALSNLPSMTEEKMAELCGTLATVESQEAVLRFIAQSNASKPGAIPALSQSHRRS
jgi:HEAT repeat protein